MLRYCGLVVQTSPLVFNLNIVSTTVRRNAASIQFSQQQRCHSGKKHKSGLRVIFVTPDGHEEECFAAPGEHLLEIAHANNVDLEGACEASLACSTCHVIVEDPKVFDSLPEASEEEDDMLDLAFGYDLSLSSKSTISHDIG
eukprot:Partr_v1_DN24156_c0_g1_i4_m71231 putative Ferredoxin